MLKTGINKINKLEAMTAELRDVRRGAKTTTKHITRDDQGQIIEVVERQGAPDPQVLVDRGLALVAEVLKPTFSDRALAAIAAVDFMFAVREFTHPGKSRNNIDRLIAEVRLKFNLEGVDPQGLVPPAALLNDKAWAR